MLKVGVYTDDPEDDTKIMLDRRYTAISEDDGVHFSLPSDFYLEADEWAYVLINGSMLPLQNPLMPRG